MGKLVAFEGIDNAGKSSVIKRLKEKIHDCIVPITVCGEFQSPITSVLHEALRHGDSPFLKTYLFACDRAWTYEKNGIPALQRGELLLWDRYVDSALAYRTVDLLTTETAIDLEFVKFINHPFRKPDLTIYIDICAKTASFRAKQVGKTEPYNTDFLEKVRLEYLNLAPEKRYFVVDGETSFGKVVKEVEQIIRKQFKELFL